MNIELLNAAVIFQCVVLTVGVIFHDHPGTVYISEDEDVKVSLWTVSADCTYGDADTSCTRVAGARCPQPEVIYTTGACDDCDVTSNPDLDLFLFKRSKISKRGCRTRGCGICSSCGTCGSGCLDYNAHSKYTINVTCWTTGHYEDDYETTSLIVSVVQNPIPTISLDAKGFFSTGLKNDFKIAVVNEPSVFEPLKFYSNVSASSFNQQGDVIFTTSATVDPSGETIEYTLASGVADSLILGTQNLFELDTDNGEVYINADPSFEYTQTMYMEICANDRRNKVCGTLTIEFIGYSASGESSTHSSPMFQSLIDLSGQSTSSSGGVTFYNNPGTVNISEDQDAGTPLWTITADCTYVEAYFGPCLRISGADCSPDLTSTTVACTECDITSNPDPDLFEIQDLTIMKRACQTSGCGICSTCAACGSGCFDYYSQSSYTINLTCWTTGHYEDANGTTSINVSVIQNPVPTINLDSSANANSSNQQGDVIFTTSTTFDPIGETIEYTLASGVGDSLVLGTKKLFELDRGNGDVYINADPSLEYTQTMYMEICVNDRRNNVCGNLTIEFSSSTYGESSTDSSTTSTSLIDSTTSSSSTSAGVTFHNNPGTVNISEDQDAGTPLWNVSADCTYVDATYRPCPRVPGADCSPDLTSTTVACTECDVTSNPDPDLFEIQEQTIMKRACQTSGCGICSTCGACGSGCLDYYSQSSYSINVTCWTTGHYEDANETTSVIVSIVQNPIPAINLDATVNATSSNQQGDVIFTTSATADPVDEIIEYTLSSGVGNSVVLETPNLFDLDTGNGDVYITADPSLEYTQTMYMDICVNDRRNNVCGNLTIEFSSSIYGESSTDSSTTSTSLIDSTTSSSSTSAGVTFHNNPGTVNISEDQDAGTPLWNVSADCTYVDATYRPCPRVPGADCSPDLTSTTVACTECDITSNPDPDLFEIQEQTIMKRACQTSGCGICSTCGACGSGCLDYYSQSSYSINVTCWTTGHYEDANETTSVIVSIVQNPIPAINLDATVNATSSNQQGDVIFTTSATADPVDEIIEYTLSSGVGNSVVLETPNLFDLDTGNGDVYITADPSLEYTQTMYMDICVNDRRNNVCGNLTIEFSSSTNEESSTDSSTTSMSLVDSTTSSSSTSAGVIFHNNPGTVYISEDQDAGTPLWNISADCTYVDATYRPCPRVPGADCSPDLTSTTVACTECDITSNPDPDLFEIQEQTIMKRACQTSGCGICSTCGACGSGCLDYYSQSSYSINVTCWTTGHYEDANETTSVIVSIVQNPIPAINLDATVNATSSNQQGDVIFTTSATADPVDEIIEYTLSSGVGNSVVLETPNLFDLDTGNGDVYITADPSLEYTQTMYMDICVNDRRNNVCGNLTIEFSSSTNEESSTDSSTTSTSLIDSTTSSSSTSAGVTFHNNPGTVYISEDQDAGTPLWNISADCTYVDATYRPCPRVPGADCSPDLTFTTVACTECDITSNSDPDLFEIQELAVMKRVCQTSGCGICSICAACGSGCLDYYSQSSYIINVTCWTTGHYEDANETTSLIVSVVQNPIPVINLDATVNASSSNQQGDVIFTTSATADPVGETIEYTLASGVGNSVVLETPNLFDLLTGSGEVYVNADPSLEYPQTMSMEICANDRRNIVCGNLTIAFKATFSRASPKESTTYRGSSTYLSTSNEPSAYSTTSTASPTDSSTITSTITDSSTRTASATDSTTSTASSTHSTSSTASSTDSSTSTLSTTHLTSTSASSTDSTTSTASSTDSTITTVSSIDSTTITASSTNSTSTPASLTESTTSTASSTDSTTSTASSTDSITSTASSTDSTTNTAFSTDTLTTPAFSIDLTTTTTSSTNSTRSAALSTDSTTTTTPSTDSITTRTPSSDSTISTASSTFMTTSTASSTESTSTTISLTDSTTSTASSTFSTTAAASSADSTTLTASSTDSTTSTASSIYSTSTTASSTDSTTSTASSTDSTTSTASSTDSTISTASLTDSTTTPASLIDSTNSTASLTLPTASTASSADSTTISASSTDSTTSTASSTDSTTGTASLTDSTTSTASSTDSTPTTTSLTDSTTSTASSTFSTTSTASSADSTTIIASSTYSTTGTASSKTSTSITASSTDSTTGTASSTDSTTTTASSTDSTTTAATLTDSTTTTASSSDSTSTTGSSTDSTSSTAFLTDSTTTAASWTDSTTSTVSSTNTTTRSTSSTDLSSTASTNSISSYNSSNMTGKAKIFIGVFVALLLLAIATVIAACLLKNKGRTPVQPMPSKPAPWAFKEAGVKPHDNFKTSVISPEVVLPGQLGISPLDFANPKNKGSV